MHYTFKMNFFHTLFFSQISNFNKIVYDLNHIVDQYEINLKDMDAHKIKYYAVLKELLKNSVDKIHQELYQYLYGWILARGELRNGYISIRIENDDEYTLFENITEYLANTNFYMDHDEFFIFMKRHYFIIKDMSLIKLFENYNANTVYKTKYFCRGYFEGIRGCINVKPNQLDCILNDSYIKQYFLDYICKYNGLKLNNNKFMWCDMNALEFICDLYNYDCNILLPVDHLLQLKTNIEKIQEAKVFNTNNLPPQFICNKIDDSAVYPYKTSVSETGFNIHLVQKLGENNDSCIHYYTTKLQISSDYGYYMEIYGQDLYKHGYMLATGGSMIIDNQMTDEIIVPLYKFNNTSVMSGPLIVKLVPKKLYLSDIIDYKVTTQSDSELKLELESRLEFESDSELKLELESDS